MSFGWKRKCFLSLVWLKISGNCDSAADSTTNDNRLKLLSISLFSFFRGSKSIWYASAKTVADRKFWVALKWLNIFAPSNLSPASKTFRVKLYARHLGNVLYRFCKTEYNVCYRITSQIIDSNAMNHDMGKTIFIHTQKVGALQRLLGLKICKL